jgi:single stranded DNA-binding protein
MLLNQVNLVGNISKEFEIRTTPNGDSVCNTEVLIENPKTKKRVYVSVTFWGDLAIKFSSLIEKGDDVFISGRLSSDSFKDKETGKEYYKLIVIGENFTLVEQWN